MRIIEQIYYRNSELYTPVREDGKVRVQEGELDHRKLLTNSPEPWVERNKLAPSRVPSDPKVNHKGKLTEESMEDWMYLFFISTTSLFL